MDFERVKRNWDRGIFTLPMMEKLVRKGLIDQAEFQVITGQTTESVSEAKERARAVRLVQNKLEREAVQTMSFDEAELAVIAKSGLFPDWTAGVAYKAKERLVWKDRVYEVQQNVTAQAHQPPDGEGMLAIYRPISADPSSGVEPAGTQADPIPFVYGMNVSTGLYYSYEGSTYVAKGDMKPCVWNPGTAGVWQWELV